MCLFCRIAAHELNAHCVYEDDVVMAFLDIQPITRGHTLIIPKQHYDNFAATPSRTFARMHAVAARLSRHYDRVLKPQGYNLLSNMREAAGQSVFHVHLHLIPRYDAQDGLMLRFNPTAQHQLNDAEKRALKLPTKKST